MVYEIKAKPTVYNGNRFRSRLEARWACFFDLLGWKWKYEPFDLNGWTPDFIVYGKDSRFVLVEIKPFVDGEILKSYQQKISKAAKGHNCIILFDGFEKSDWGGVVAGYQFDTVIGSSIYNGEPFQIHWKDLQDGIDSQYDLGSLFFAFDGLLWTDDKNRKLFLSNNAIEYKNFMNKWLDAGDKTTFHYE